jgi:hypothetical protein
MLDALFGGLEAVLWIRAQIGWIRIIFCVIRIGRYHFQANGKVGKLNFFAGNFYYAFQNTENY